VTVFDAEDRIICGLTFHTIINLIFSMGILSFPRGFKKRCHKFSLFYLFFPSPLPSSKKLGVQLYM